MGPNPARQSSVKAACRRQLVIRVRGILDSKLRHPYRPAKRPRQGGIGCMLCVAYALSRADHSPNRIDETRSDRK